jgi:hypothetical protein
MNSDITSGLLAALFEGLGDKGMNVRHGCNRTHSLWKRVQAHRCHVLTASAVLSVTLEMLCFYLIRRRPVDESGCDDKGRSASNGSPTVAVAHRMPLSLEPEQIILLVDHPLRWDGRV